MTPVGHAAVGWVLGHRHRFAVTTAVVVGALAPDIDFVLWWAPQFNAWHRVVTHNLPFALAVAAIAGWVAHRRKASVRAVALGAFVGVLSHLLVDACMDTSASNGIGVAIAWPLSDAMWSPFNLLTPTNAVGWADHAAAARGTLQGLAYEGAVAVLALALWWRGHRKTTPCPESSS